MFALGYMCFVKLEVFCMFVILSPKFCVSLLDLARPATSICTFNIATNQFEIVIVKLYCCHQKQSQPCELVCSPGIKLQQNFFATLMAVDFNISLQCQR